MKTYMRSDSFKSTGNGTEPAGKAKKVRRPRSIPEEQIPPEPPGALKGQYVRSSRSYGYWCVGMLVWCALCVAYFVTTGQWTNTAIGVSLGVLLVAMIVLPAMLFGGATWYKRLGWEMLLLCLFCAMWVYPVIVIGIGIAQRRREGRYHWPIYGTDLWHSILCMLTVVMTLWTALVTIRVARLVRHLARGEFGGTEVTRA